MNYFKPSINFSRRLISLSVLLVFILLFQTACQKAVAFKGAGGGGNRVSGGIGAIKNCDSSPFNNDPEVKGFSCTLYPLLQNQKSVGGFGCLNCHAGSNPSAPAYLSADQDKILNVQETKALILATKKVNLANPSLSAIVGKMRNDQHNCDTHCEEWADKFVVAIDEWIKQSGITSGDGPSIVNVQTAVQNLPKPDTIADGAEQKLSFDISTASKIPGAVFEITYIKLSAFGWGFCSPTIRASKAVAVKSIAILLNDINLDGNATWRTLNVTVAANSTITGNVSTACAPVSTIDGVDQFKIAFGFEKLEEGTAVVPPPPTGLNAAQRLAAVKNILTTSCVSCHGAVTPSGGVNLAALAAAGATEAQLINFTYNGSFGNNTRLFDPTNPQLAPIVRVIRATANLTVGNGQNQQPMPPLGSGPAGNFNRTASGDTVVDFITKNGQP